MTPKHEGTPGILDQNPDPADGDSAAAVRFPGRHWRRSPAAELAVRSCDDGTMTSPTEPPQLTPEAWLAAFAAALGTDVPTPEEIEALLALAGTAAHASARTAAPIACFLVGRSGVSLDTAARAAAAISGEPL